MAEWYPKPEYPHSNAAGSTLTSSTPGAIPQPPKFPLPEVGDTVTLAVEPWGHV